MKTSQSKAAQVWTAMLRLDEDKTDDHISFLRNHPHVTDNLRRKLELLKKEKASLEAQHDDYYNQWVQSGNAEYQDQVNAIDNKLDNISKYIKELVDQHVGLQ